MKHFGFFSYIKERWVVLISLITLFVGLLLLLTLFPSKTPDSAETQEIFILNLSLTNWGVWITIIGGILACFWGLYQYDKSKNRSQQEKGAEIAKLFSEDLLYKCTILGRVILDSELNDIIKPKTLNENDFKNFDRNEAFDIYKDDELFLKLKQVLGSSNVQQTYLRTLDSQISLNKINKKRKYTNKEAKKLFILNNSNLPFQFIQLISSVLNDLEYICMYISSQSAGSKYVYQSLHQIFLKTIKLLYPIICMGNDDYTDKYYVNIIYVFNMWQKEKNKSKKQEGFRKRIAYWLLNPKIKTV